MRQKLEADAKRLLGQKLALQNVIEQAKRDLVAHDGALQYIQELLAHLEGACTEGELVEALSNGRLPGKGVEMK